MTIHYHGTPITPRGQLSRLAGRNFCVSYAAPGDVLYVHQIGQSVMLDNGAFSFWRQGVEVDDEFWAGYYDWAEPWLDRHTTWAVIPDVIDGSVEENDRLIKMWPFGEVGAPVWHMHEPIDRLLRLCDLWPRVCFGSSGAFAVLNTPQWQHRMEEAFNALCPNEPPPVWLHMLRGMALAEGPYPFASLDSTDIARNHAGAASVGRQRQDIVRMADRWDGIQCPAQWAFREQLELVS